MKPVNNKSMISFLFGQMEKLDNGEITNEQAREQSNLAKQVNSAMKYEIDRARVKMECTAGVVVDKRMRVHVTRRVCHVSDCY